MIEKIQNYKKTCPRCNEEITYKNKYSHKKSLEGNKVCGKCSRQLTGLKNKGKVRNDDFKKNLSEKMKGHPSIINNKDRSKKISKSLKGREIKRWDNHIKETITCLQCSKIVESQPNREHHKFCNRDCMMEFYFDEKIWHPIFNPKACEIIENYGVENGYNFQHALNGGEFRVKPLNYFVDGYDKDKNVVIEYYEKHHLSPKQKTIDKKRREEIIKTLNCKFIILYYNKKIKVYE